MASTHRWWLVASALGVLVLLSWARRGPGSTPSEPAMPVQSEARTGADAAPRLPEPSTLYEEATSAYQARLFAEGDSIVLVTRAGFTRLEPGLEPAPHEVALGPVAARRGSELVFWRSGKLRALSIEAEGERELAALPVAPQYLLASEGQLVWIQTARATGSSLQTLDAAGVRVIFETDESVSAAAMQGAVVYWVSERRDGSWHIGRVGLDGQQTSTAVQQGRPPAMLAPGPDGVYFYAGAERGVRRLTFDLTRETSVLPRVICSPLVVSSRVVCAQVGGLFDISPSRATPRFLASERSGPITAVAAAHGHAYWVAERGAEQLVVRSVALPEL
ncbi:MAG TPA: hypothetical protein VMG12_04045 [Polyangiaceae bacterium]|nr:hypothetical protein [Polyangiaceae bacterium]